MVGVDDDVVPLADADVETGYRDRLDWDHVCCDDGKGVANEGHGVAVLHRAIDQPEEMALACCEGDFLVAPGSSVWSLVLPVEKDIVAWRR